MLRPRLKTILICFTILVTLVIISGLGIGVYSYFALEKEMSQKLESKKFLIPTEYYAAPPTFAPRSFASAADLENQFAKQGFRKRNFDQRILPGDYFIATREECSARTQIPMSEDQEQCLVHFCIQNIAARITFCVDLLFFEDYPL